MRHFLFVLCLVLGLGVFSNAAHSFEPGDIVTISKFCTTEEQAVLFSKNKATECYEATERFYCMFIQYHGDLPHNRIASCVPMLDGKLLPVSPVFSFAPKDVSA